MQLIIQVLFGLSLLGFIINLILGYLPPSFFPVHLVLGLASTFLGVLAAQMSTSYYLGTRDRIAEEGRLEAIPQAILDEAKIIKKNLFASCGMAMILILVHAVLGGCVWIQILPPLPHHVLGYLVIMTFARSFRATLAFHRFRSRLLGRPS